MEPLSKVEQLAQWFGGNGGHPNEGIDMFHSLEYGYHYIAKTKPIGPDEIVCKCSFGLTLSHLNVLQAPPTEIRNYSSDSICSALIHNQKIDKSTVASFFLAEQRLKGQDSFWFPYIQLRPTETEMTTPLWFKDDELAYLKGTTLFSNDTPFERTCIGIQESSYREQWERGMAELRNSGRCTINFTWKLFLWAATIFSSRSFTSDLFTNEHVNGHFPILYPVLDFFNHRLGTKATWQFHNGDFCLYIEEKVEQGHQIFNNYSPKGNEDLLMGFGFCIPYNPYDRVAVRLDRVESDTHRKLRDIIPSHWQSETWNPNESVFYLQSPSQYVSCCSSMLGIPTLSCLRGISPELTKSVYTIIVEHTKALPKEALNEKQIWVATIDVLLHQMENTLEGITRRDGELPDFPLTVGPKAALIYRTGQVNILQEVVSDLRGFMNSIRAGDVSVEDSM